MGPVLGSSANCKRAASVNIGTNATCLQSAHETQLGRLYYQTGHAAKFKTKSRRGHFELENKNYGKRKRGTPGQKKGLFQMTNISPCVGTLWHG